ncbi:cadherin-23 isoform X2 [Cylas formicarius]|uniref:cadherin-23 isoform X2 n=1 Tax=Cylas formicarius TaxID=197179 RepID=UPI002958D9B6|nr:cadherin-23 isoform X2 [Cylas formicarius]
MNTEGRFKNRLRTFWGHFVKIKFKSASLSGTPADVILFLGLVLSFSVNRVVANRPPRFLMDGQPEIVLRLKEGEETPIGSLLYSLKGFDPDDDKLEFGIVPSAGSNVIRIENTSSTEAEVYLDKLLDREERDEYALVLTLTDGHLGLGNYITQSLLILVEDVNDNTPTFKKHRSSVTLKEDAKPRILAKLEATDADIGPYGQVVYHFANDVDRDLFGLSTTREKAVVRLIGPLDYEKQTVHQIKVLAVDRAKEGRVNTGTAVILVKVEDVEDQPPEFVKVTPVVRLSENSPIGSPVLQVTAVDGDRGINNKIQYYLSTNNLEQVADLFNVEEDTGRVVTAGVIDREALPLGSSSHILEIIATEVGGSINPQPYATTEVTIIITDENDETPSFANPFYECEIAENSPRNTPVTFLGSSSPEVFDFDQGLNGTFQLYLKGGSEVFELLPKRVTNEATFSIKVKNNTALDYEKIRQINFTIVAKEVVKDNPKFSEVPVTVHVLDRNDNYPEFTTSYYEVSVPENCEVGTTVAWVQALDEDSDNFGTLGVRYTNIAGTIAYMLDINPISGIVTVKIEGGPNWDREQISRHFLTVEARDDLGHGNRNSVPLIINLEDVNDNPPVFTQNRYEARVLEGKFNFENPLNVEARDADLNGTKNAEIEYYLFGPFHENFTIDSVTGKISLKEPLDFELLVGPPKENIRILPLSVRARDWGTPSLFSDVELLVYVEDINDHTPVFEESFYNVSIPENITGGTDIIQVQAYDDDGSSPNNRVVYRIQSGALDKFVIDSESGIISVAHGANLDPDLTQPKKMHYSLNVLALDGGSGDYQLQAAVTVEILITDINNKRPKISQPFEVLINENSPVGVPVTKINATDLDDSADLRYTIDSDKCEAKNELGVVLKPSEVNCSSFFSVSSKTGLITIARLIDRETVESFRLGVLVRDDNSDTGPQQDSAFIKIKVEDINDNSPKFDQPYYKFAAQENSKIGVPIGTVRAYDADKNKTVTYSLDQKGYYLGLIHLDNNTGNIVVAHKVDHEEFQWLNFTVKATDSGIPSRSSRVEVFVQVLDENDNNPVFLPEPKWLVIPEDIPVGTEIATVNATDADSGEFGKITYFLDRLSSHEKFQIDSDTGTLIVTDELDREENDKYLLIIEAWDNYQYGFNNGESRNAFKHLNVTIFDVNDNRPHLHQESKCVNITEFQEPGEPITIIHASDADDPNTSNGQVIIDIADGNQDNLFEVDQISDWSAEVRPVSSLRGLHGDYTLTIRAQDLGTPSFLVEKPLKICVADYNDHPPVFVSPPHNSTLRVPENATIGSALIQIKATDEDFGPNGAVRYRLKSDPAGHWKTFELQPVSGILELKLPLDRDVQKIYDLRIEAYDLGIPTSLSSDLDLTVYVTDVHGYQPQFLVDEFVVEFTENTNPGVESRRLPKTLDRDKFEYDGPAAPVCYFIVGGNENGLFYLDPFDHTISITSTLDREETDLHLIFVKATENCANPPKPQNSFDANDDTQIKVIVKVLDVNDNPPKFTRRIFTGGVSTATPFGTNFMQVAAEDPDSDENAIISYYIVGKVKMTLTEGLDHLSRPPFIVERDTGAVRLNFDPQQGMKGYFDFAVLANDTAGLHDTARVFIYLLREDQRVRFVLRQTALELRNNIDVFRDVLGNVTGAIVNVDEFRVHTNHDGTIDKTRTDLYLHLVNRKDNSILEVAEVLRLVDQNTEKLDSLFKDFNVLDTQPGGIMALQSNLQSGETTFWLSAASLCLLLLLILCLALCVNQRQTYHRKLKAATATAYESDIDGRGLSILSGRVPNTNKHSMEGSNPMWLKAYETEWYKSPDDLSQTSDHDSLDENVICGELTDTCDNDEQTEEEKRQNLYQTLPVPMPRKLETTEL